ncbi:MAG: hypothetical protein MUO42_05550 [Anaerolineaceae bacterium]|nr:hypothetical protein [Anaerolineaceae bacterium]
MVKMVHWSEKTILPRALFGFVFLICQSFNNMPAGIRFQEPAPQPEAFPEITPDPPTSDQIYRWVMSYWNTNNVECNIFIDNTGEPTRAEIAASCGEDILNAWENTPPCLKKNTTKCTGLYLSFFGRTTPEEVERISPTPEIIVKAGTVNCPAWGTCDENPKLVFTVENDFQPEAGNSLAVQIGNEVTYCEASSCTLDMPVTKLAGSSIKYWVETKGDEVLYEHNFRIRNLPLEDSSSTQLVQLLGKQWQGTVDTCANIWDYFPDLETEKAAWLARGDTPDFLHTTVDYALLAGRLIWHGYVDASGCENNGLLPNGAANS